jgi:hypothetical protein
MFNPEDGCDMFLRNPVNFQGLHDVISQKREFFNHLFFYTSHVSFSVSTIFIVPFSISATDLFPHGSLLHFSTFFYYVYILVLFFPSSAGALSAIYQFSLTVRPFVLEPVTHGNHLLLIENQPDDESIKGVKPHPLTIFISSHLSSPSLANTHVHISPLSEQAHCLPKTFLCLS